MLILTFLVSINPTDSGTTPDGKNKITKKKK